MTTTTNREAEITIDDKTPSITIVREFDAPAKAVFRAHTEPDLFVQWVGPDSLDSSRVDRWDGRTGGEWRYVSIRNDEEHWFRAVSTKSGTTRSSSRPSPTSRWPHL